MLRWLVRSGVALSANSNVERESAKASRKASEAKREFGEVLLKAQSAPVGINKNGKPVAVVLSASDYEQLEELRQERLLSAINEGLADLDAGSTSEGAAVLTRLRNRVS